MTRPPSNTGSVGQRPTPSGGVIGPVVPRPIRIALVAANPLSAKRFVQAMAATWESLGRALPGAYHRYRDPASHEALRRLRAEPVPGVPPRLAGEAIRVGLHGLIGMTGIEYEVEVWAEPTAGDAGAIASADAVWMLVGGDELASTSWEGPFRRLTMWMASPSRADSPGLLLDMDAEDGPAQAFLDADPIREIATRNGPIEIAGGMTWKALAAEAMESSELVSRLIGKEIRGALVSTPGRRVLAPLLLSAGVEPGRPNRRLFLIVDPAILDRSATAGLPRDVIEAIEEAPGDIPGMTLYSLGRIEPVAPRPNGSDPPSAHRSPRLIGPILDVQPDDAAGLVVACGPILDLDDFAATSWRDRLAVRDLSDPQIRPWPRTFDLATLADLASALDALSRGDS